MIILIIYGFVNAHIIRVRTFNIMVHKEAGTLKSLNIAMASDIHLSSIIGKRRIEAITAKINSLNPDIVLLPGDIVDGDLNPVIDQNSGESLRKIRASLGVYAITGNHEYYGGIERACEYITNHNVIILRDSAAFINDSFYIVGREDREVRKQKVLKKLWEKLTKNIW